MLDVSLDYMVMDWTQSISYYPRVSELTYGPVASALALKREDHKTAQMGTGSLELAKHGCTWEVWRETMTPQLVPKRGDKFVASTITGTQTWFVEDVDYSDETTRYRLSAVQQGNNS